MDTTALGPSGLQCKGNKRIFHPVPEPEAYRQLEFSHTHTSNICLHDIVS